MTSLKDKSRTIMMEKRSNFQGIEIEGECDGIVIAGGKFLG